jgi:hypothetical protein
MSKPQKKVIDEWMEDCTCCDVCQAKPCDGVMSGGLCDNLCYCDEEEEVDDGMDECGMLPDGTCMLAGTEHCDFDCKYREDIEMQTCNTDERTNEEKLLDNKIEALIYELCPNTSRDWIFDEEIPQKLRELIVCETTGCNVLLLKTKMTILAKLQGLTKLHAPGNKELKREIYWYVIDDSFKKYINNG